MLSKQQLGSLLWSIADTGLRGKVEDYKAYILSLLFFKRLSDNYEWETRARLAEFEERYKAKPNDKQLARIREEGHAFIVPPNSFWSDVRDAPLEKKNERLDMAVNQIAERNPALRGIINAVRWNEPAPDGTGRKRLDPEVVAAAINQLDPIRLDNSNVSPDVLGDAYEYLIKKFADENKKGTTAGQFYTPPEIRDIIIRTIQPEADRTFYDPTCGSGGFLIDAAKFVKQKTGDAKTGAKSNNGVTSDAGPAILFKSRRVQFLETYNAMNWRKFVLLGCVVACVFAASTATAQMRGYGNSMSRMGMRGAFTPRSIARMPMHRAPMLGTMGRMPMHRAPMMNSALGLRRFNRFNDGDFDRDDRFHRFNNFNEIIFISDLDLPWWSGWGWGPWWDWNWGYPYGSYYSGYGYGYGNYGYGYGSSGYDYGYGYPSGSYYGSYYSGTDYGNDHESAVRNVLAEYTVSWNRHDMAAFGRLFTENCDYVNIAGVHWKGVQENVQQHAELFQNRLKTAVQTLTGAEVRFPTPDVALVHATWDVTGWSRPTGEAVPVLKEITTMVMVKTNGKWLITAFQNTESWGSTK